MPSQDSNDRPQKSKAIFDTTIKAWLAAMEKAGRIKPGGRLLFINRRNGGST